MRDYREEIVSIFKQREEDLLDGLQPSSSPVTVDSLYQRKAVDS